MMMPKSLYPNVFPPIQRALLASQCPVSAQFGYKTRVSSACCEVFAAGLRGFLGAEADLLGLQAVGEGEGGHTLRWRIRYPRSNYLSPRNFPKQSQTPRAGHSAQLPRPRPNIHLAPKNSTAWLKTASVGLYGTPGPLQTI